LKYTIQNDDRDVIDGVERLISQGEPDRLVWLYAVAYRSAYGNDPEPQDLERRVLNLEFVNLNQFRRALDHAKDVRNMIARGESDRVLVMEYPNIASIAARSRQAADDVRRLMRLIDELKPIE
jgi:hypothetical protein